MRAKALLHLADSHGQLIHFPAPLSAALKSCWWRGSICGGLYQIHSLHEAQAVLLLHLRAITARTAMVPALCIVFPMVGTTHTHTHRWRRLSPEEKNLLLLMMQVRRSCHAAVSCRQAVKLLANNPLCTEPRTSSNLNSFQTAQL